MLDAKSISSKSNHEVVLISREKLTINGIKEIINFDENNVNLKTQCGDLLIEGENIHINILNIEKGDIEIQGKISGLNYYDSLENEKRTLLSRIFK